MSRRTPPACRRPGPKGRKLKLFTKQHHSGCSLLTYSIHISTAKTWRGGENQIWLLARGLQKRGQKVLIAAPPNTPLLERCQACGIATHALGLRGELDPVGAF